MTTISASIVKNLREITGVAMMDCKKALVETNGDIEAAKDYLRKKGQAKALKKSSRDTMEGAVGLSTSDDGKCAALLKVGCETDFVARNDRFLDFIQKLTNQVCQKGNDNLMSQNLISDVGNVEAFLTRTIAELGENIKILESRKLEIENGVIGGYIHSNGKIGVVVPLETDKPCNDKRLLILARDVAMHIAAFPAEAVRADQVSSDVLEKEKEVFAAQARESGKPDNIIEKMIDGRMKKFLKEVCVESQAFVKDPQISVNQLILKTSQELGVKIEFSRFEKYQF